MALQFRQSPDMAYAVLYAVFQGLSLILSGCQNHNFFRVHNGADADGQRLGRNF